VRNVPPPWSGDLVLHGKDAFLPWHPLAAGGDAAGVVRLAASRAAEARRPCKWQSLGC